MGIYLHSKLDNTMTYSSSLNKDHQHNLDHYILGDLLSETSWILWNFYATLLKMETLAQPPPANPAKYPGTPPTLDRTPPVTASELKQINNDLLKTIYET